MRKLITLIGSLSLFAALVVPADQAEAAPPGSAFDPGLIITDSLFFDFGTMTVEQIQEFLDSRVSECRADPDSPACLKDYTMDTPATEATEGRCEAIPARSGATAAQIIHDVANACGINPEVLIVTLQKEQGLVTSTKPTPICIVLQWAMAAPTVTRVFAEKFMWACSIRFTGLPANCSGTEILKVLSPGFDLVEP